MISSSKGISSSSLFILCYDPTIFLALEILLEHIDEGFAVIFESAGLFGEVRVFVLV